MIYFADDDNSYDVRIFEEIRRTARVSVFPVGLVLKYGVSAPIVRGGAVTGFYDAFQAGRVFAMDMAGFAVSVKLFKSRPKATFPAKVSLLEENVKVYYHWVYTVSLHFWVRVIPPLTILASKSDQNSVALEAGITIHIRC